MALTEKQSRELDDAVREWQGRLSPRRGYPAARKRIKPDTVAGFKVAKSPAEAAIAAASAAVSGEGTVWHVSRFVTAATINVHVSQAISRPFIIERVTYWSDSTTPFDVNGVRFRLLVSDDNSTAGGESATGTRIDPLGNISESGADFIVPHTVRESFNAGIAFTTVPKFLKAVLRNLTAASKSILITVSLRYLN